MTGTSRDHRTKRIGGLRKRPSDQDEYMGQDSRSISTTMGVRIPPSNRTAGFPLHAPLRANPIASGESFVIPRGWGCERMKADDDDVSVLTEYSGMEEEEDACSQVTAAESWTVVTTATDSTTIPTRNIATLKAEQQRKRRVACENGLPLDNSQFKRRRKR